MLRLPPYRYHRPRTLAEALDLLAEHKGDVMPVSGGTDLVPNMKHRLFTPGHVVALKGIEALSGVRQDNGDLVIGAAETLTAIAAHPMVRLHFTALSDAAEHIAGPQIRNAGTIGGNLCLDTRCTYYNQTHFWRDALGYCLKKDGSVCHVTKVGKKCVAAHSADTPPVLIALAATVDLSSANGQRTMPVADFFVTDGIWNTRREPDEVVTAIRIPTPTHGLRTAYAKLRQRNAIDFPLLTVAVAAELDAADRIESLVGVVTALGSRPRVLSGLDEIALDRTLDDDLIDEIADRAQKQCRPLENIVVDTDWRRAMVPVYVRRALRKLLN